MKHLALSVAIGICTIGSLSTNSSEALRFNPNKSTVETLTMPEAPKCNTGCTETSIYALDFPWLSFKMKDASEITVAADNLTMNYSDGNLLLTSPTVSETLPVADITSMVFTNREAGIDEINVALSENGYYYTLDGVKVGEFTSVDDGRRSLPSGMYIVRTESKSFKIIF